MVALCCQVVHSTVQLTYALIFGTFGPMLQSVFNLAVLYQVRKSGEKTVKNREKP